MSCRHGRTLLAMMVVGPLVSLGCANGRLDGPVTTTVMGPSPPTASMSGELTPSQSAQLCLTTAEALEKKGYVAEAIHQYENARRHDPQLSSVSRRLAVLYDRQGDPQRAEAEWMRAQQEQPGDAELLNDVGYFHYRHGHLATAESWLQNAISADPNCRRAWINLGQVLAKQGRMEESYQAFAHVLRPAEAYSNLGVLLAKQGRTSEARTALQQALQLDPTLKQPQAFLIALPPTPALLPPGITHTAPPPLIVPRTPPPAVVLATPPPPLALPTPPSPPVVAYRPPPPPVAPTPSAALPIIRTVYHPPSVGTATPQAEVIPCAVTMPAISRPAPIMPLPIPSPQAAKPFILHVSPPTPPVPKTEIRQPEVVITDCQGNPDN